MKFECSFTRRGSQQHYLQIVWVDRDLALEQHLENFKAEVTGEPIVREFKVSVTECFKASLQNNNFLIQVGDHERILG